MGRLLKAFLLFISIPLFAAEEISLSDRFKSDREGMSAYHSVLTLKKLNSLREKVDEVKLFEIFSTTLNSQDEDRLCIYTLKEKLAENLEQVGAEKSDIVNYVYFLRYKNLIDDTVVKLFLDAQKFEDLKITYSTFPNPFTLVKKEEIYNGQIELISSFGERFLKNNCLDDAFQNFYGEMVKINSKMKPRHLKAMVIEALRIGKIDTDTFEILERARKSKLHEQNLTLRSYYQKVKSLRIQYPLGDQRELSNFVTTIDKKEKLTRRQALYERYTDLQIILMANVIKKLKTRIESSKIEINVYDKKSELAETVPLEPMERFRFAIKILRKEMRHLSLNTYFSGRTPAYIDLITAAYEVGIVPGSELDEIASLQEIWNPKKTFWDMAGIWIKSFANIAAIAIPAPYGFIPTLAIVVIEATLVKKDKPKDETASLF